MSRTFLIQMLIVLLVGVTSPGLATNTPTIELETAVHFLAPDGSDLLVEPGTYSVEAAEEWIRVVPSERHNALLIEANKGTHELELEQVMAMSEPGEADNEKDNHYVMVLLPGGQSLEATGTYSGIRPRGLFDTAFARMKETAGKGVSTAGGTVSGGAVQWTRLSQLASAAARTEARDWLRQAYIDSSRCKVMGVSAIGTPGVLKSRYTFQDKIAKALKEDGASQTIAQGWAKAFKESWEQWAKNVTIPGLPFYPAFSAFPGPTAPPMPNVPFPLASMPSSAAAAMSPGALSQKVLANIGSVADSQTVKSAVNAFATDLGGRFATCLGACQLMNVLGSGPIPTFAPPFVPAGPVQNGTCREGRISSVAGF